MSQPIRKASESPDVKQFVSKQYQQIFKDPSLKLLLERLQSRYGMTQKEALKAVLTSMESTLKDL